MATLTLVKAKTDPGFPANTTAEFRFDNYSMGTLTFPVANQWKNFASNSRTFSSPGNLKLYMGNGVLVNTCGHAISASAETNGERTLTCAYGPFTVIFNVTEP
ncbi:MAG: hypothetical protein AAF572_22420 [Cyanobacteria bacterium P01_B01_bin.77]